jgi:hypothetical protein
MLVGIGDIIFTFVFWSFIETTSFDSGAFRDLSQSGLNDLVRSIEFYKIQHGDYPDSLQQLLPGLNRSQITDFMQIGHTKGNADLYNYKKLGTKYVLYSSGEDHIPNTRDDLYPNIPIDSGKIGLTKPK